MFVNIPYLWNKTAVSLVGGTPFYKLNGCDADALGGVLVHLWFYWGALVFVYLWARYLGMVYQMATRCEPVASTFDFVVFSRGGAQMDCPWWHAAKFRV